ncbi:MAG: WecB/TagA/CpsF family glycosyltransferase [Bacillota bacterium]
MRKRVDIMGAPIDQVTLDHALHRFIEFVNNDRCSMIVTPNTEIVMEAQTDEELLQILMEADLVIPDGIGLIYASKILNRGLTERVTGIDLMARILNYCNEEKRRVYFLGGKPGVAEKACENIKGKYPQISIVGVRDGYFKPHEEAEIIEEINHHMPDVLFVALGAPKQEKWIYGHRNDLKVKAAMGVGGSVDVWAGTVKRAPDVYQKFGLEWFYRLMKEPWRYKRMMVLPKFMVKVLVKRVIG